MPRTARIVYPGQLYHVTHRGNNQQFIFHDNNDYILYLKYAERLRQKYEVDIFAFCLMGNHVHFIVRPNNKNSLAKMFGCLHARYAQYYLKKFDQKGHVWQGRYYSCILQGVHIKQAVRYVEQNPVRAKIVKECWQYTWSSARAHLGLHYNWITLEDIKEIIDVENWKSFLSNETEDEFLNQLRSATKRNSVLGSEKFIHKLEKDLGIKIVPNTVGRPRKN